MNEEINGEPPPQSDDDRNMDIERALTKIPDDEVIYRDGKPVSDRPRIEILKILTNHVEDREHPDYNPGDCTAGAACTVARVVFTESEAGKEKTRDGGRKRALQKKLAAAAKEMQIRDAEKEHRSKGITQHLNKRIAATTGLPVEYVKKTRRRIRVRKGAEAS